MSYHTRTYRLLTLALALLLPLALPAQQVQQPPLPPATAPAALPSTSGRGAGDEGLPQANTTGTAVTSERQLPIQNPESKIQNSQLNDDVVELSPFTVTGEQDTGYQALSTASGSRIRTDLKNTSAPISPFTEEFLADIGATSLEDLLTYAGNIEDDLGDASAGFGGTGGFRIRGLAASTSVNFFRSSAGVDLFNMSRVEMASGANSILFGMGSPGGVITYVFKRADARRNKLRIKNTIGSWDSPAVSTIPYYRAELDYNLVLLPRTLGLRLLALYEDGRKNNMGAGGSWRYGNEFLGRRVSPVVYYRPFKNTTIHLQYEAGQNNSRGGFPWNATDLYSAWTDAGSRIMQGFGSAYAVPGTRQFNVNNTNYVLVGNSGDLYDYRQAYFTDNRYYNQTLWNQARSDTSYYYNYSSPGRTTKTKIRTASVFIEQRIGKASFELAYFDSKNNNTGHTTGAGGGAADVDTGLSADPNSLVSSYIWNSTTNLLDNPNVGRYYMEGTWRLNNSLSTNKAVHLTTDYTFDLKKFGRHHFLNLLERSWGTSKSATRVEILVDEDQRAITNVTTPSNSVNMLTRRQYVTLGDYTTYYQGDWRTPLDPFRMNGHEYRPFYVVNGPNATDQTKNTIDSISFVLQSYWLKGRLITTFGARLDFVDYRLRTTEPITDPNDPRILNKTRVLNENDLGPWDTPTKYKPWTYTLGGVYHFCKYFSAFGNHSNNRQLPPLDGRTVLPYGRPPPIIEGRSTDYGVMFNILGDDKIMLRLTRFDTRQIHGSGPLHNAANAANNTGSGMPGMGPLSYIYNALYNLTPNNSLPGASGPGPMPEEMYRAMPIYTAGLTDVHSRGYEAELVANFTKNFTMRATFSYSDRDRANTMKEVFDYFNANIPVWMSMAEGYTMTGSLAGTPVKDYIWQQLFGADGQSGARLQLANEMTSQTGPLGSRPYKFNVFASYKISKGMFKGLKLGGGVRYQSYPLIPDPNRIPPYYTVPPRDATSLEMDPEVFRGGRGMVHGSPLMYYDAMLSYNCKLFGRVRMTLQLNINNIFNTDVVTEGRFSVFGEVIRVYVNPPRNLIMSATFDF